MKLGSLILAIVPLCAHAVTLEIDSILGMSNSPGATVPIGNRLNSQRLSQGVLVSSSGGFAAVVEETGSTGTGWKRNDPSVRSALGGTTAGGTLSYSSPLEFSFFVPNNASAPQSITSFSFYTDWFGDGSFVQATARDISGNIVGSVSGFEHIGQLNVGTQFTITGTNIAKVIVNGTSTTAISNIQFTPAPAPATISGTLTLSDTIGNSGTETIIWTLSNNVNTYTGPVVVTDFGVSPYTLTVPSAAPAGPYTLRFKGGTFLSKTLNVTLSGVSLTSQNATLKNGDVDQNGEVGPSDFELVIAQFGGPGTADADNNGEVGPSDFEIVVTNFGIEDE